MKINATTSYSGLAGSAISAEGTSFQFNQSGGWSWWVNGCKWDNASMSCLLFNALISFYINLLAWVISGSRAGKIACR